MPIEDGKQQHNTWLLNVISLHGLQVPVQLKLTVDLPCYWRSKISFFLQKEIQSLLFLLWQNHLIVKNVLNTFSINQTISLDNPLIF